MQYTDNYSLRKPQMAETASVADINYNTDRIDAIMADDRQISVAMYVSGNTYNTGDLVGYENPSTHHIRVYRCLIDNVTGTWDSTKWTLTNLAAEIIDAKQSGGTEVIANPTGTAAGTLNTVEIDNVIYDVGGDSANQNIADAFSELQTYAVGDYCIYESILYKCTTAITTAGAWDSSKWTSCVVTDEMGQGGGGSSTFAGLTDVDFSNLTDEDFAQYDATAQKWKNVAISGVSVQPIIYSDNEIEVGVWCDGKPLYQRSYTLTSQKVVGQSWSSVGITISGADYIRNAWVYRSITKGTYAIGSTLNQSTGEVKLSTFINNLELDAGSVITLQYTKTNDTAGSGTWTPSGVPAVHYSTSEHVVGTDENGNTIYEKTYTGLSVATNGANWVSINGVDTSGMSSVIDCIAYMNRTNGKLRIALGEYESYNNVLRLTVVNSTFNRTVNVVILRYTKSSS